MKTKLTVIKGGDAKTKLENKLVKEAIRVCVDRDSGGNIQAMLRKLKKMNTKTKPKLDLVVQKSSSETQSDFETPELRCHPGLPDQAPSRGCPRYSHIQDPSVTYLLFSQVAKLNVRFHFSHNSANAKSNKSVTLRK